MDVVYSIKGFVWADTFSLTFWQFWIIIGQTTYWTIRALRPPESRRLAIEAGLSLCLLMMAFRGVMLGIDTRMTWNQLPRLTSLSWGHRLASFGMVNYLKFQPPLWMLWVTSIPSFIMQQWCALLASWCLVALLIRRGDRQIACLLLGTPLFQFMATQPMNDLYVAVAAFMARDALRSGSRWKAAVWLCLACQIKYTAYLMIPIFAWALREWIALPVASLVVYWCGASGSFWGTLQARYLLHTFSMGMFRGHHAVWDSSSLQCVQSGMEAIARTVAWRLKTLTMVSVQQSVIWLFPWYGRWTLHQWCALAVILIGYGNIKYTLLLLALF